MSHFTCKKSQLPLLNIWNKKVMEQLQSCISPGHLLIQSIMAAPAVKPVSLGETSC